MTLKPLLGSTILHRAWQEDGVTCAVKRTTKGVQGLLEIKDTHSPYGGPRLPTVGP